MTDLIGTVPSDGVTRFDGILVLSRAHDTASDAELRCSYANAVLIPPFLYLLFGLIFFYEEQYMRRA